MFKYKIICENMICNFSFQMRDLGFHKVLFILSIILPGKLTENTFSFAASTWGIVTGDRRGMNEPIVNWGLLGDRDGLSARLGI